MNPGFEEFEYFAFTQNVERKLGIRLRDYKVDQMRRRLAVQAQKHGANTFAQFYDLMQRDPQALSAFLDTMTINVTELFRNPDLFEVLRGSVLPPLLKARMPGTPIRVWSAGCSYGAEAYTLSVVMSEDFGPDFRVDGTDIDLAVLTRANSPQFTALDMQNVSPEMKARYFRTFDDRTWTPTGDLRSHMSFFKHDLLADPYPRERYDLIACRNVVIYFNDEAKRRIFEGFFRALKPGGLLFVGGAERLVDYNQMGYELDRPFFYRKPALREALRRAA